MWIAAILCGGLVLLVVFFATIGVIDFSQAPELGIITLAIAVFWLGAMWEAARSRGVGGSRWHDRERRGFCLFGAVP